MLGESSEEFMENEKANLENYRNFSGARDSPSNH